MTDIEVKKAYNLLLDYCNSIRTCDDCVLYSIYGCATEFRVRKFDIEEGSESNERD